MYFYRGVCLATEVEAKSSTDFTWMGFRGSNKYHQKHSEILLFSIVGGFLKTTLNHTGRKCFCVKKAYISFSKTASS